jgi:RHS repeat-associated protein
LDPARPPRRHRGLRRRGPDRRHRRLPLRPLRRLLASVTSATPSPWRYQGKLIENSGPGTSELYDFGFRSYAPGLAAFTSLDDLTGSAQNPLSLNRFLYAAANPETLVDPDGHCYRYVDDFCADHLSGGPNAIQRKDKEKVHQAEIRRRTKANDQIQDAYEHHKTTAPQKALNAAIKVVKKNVAAAADARESTAIVSSSRVSQIQAKKEADAAAPPADSTGGGFFGNPTLTTIGVGGSVNAGLPGFYFSIDLDVHIDSNWHVFVTSTNGLRPGSGVDANVSWGGTVSDARRDSDLGGPFFNVGGSTNFGIGPAQEPLGVSADYYEGTGSDGHLVHQESLGASVGGKVTGILPSETHAGTTSTFVQGIDPVGFIDNLIFGNGEFGPYPP